MASQVQRISIPKYICIGTIPQCIQGTHYKSCRNTYTCIHMRLCVRSKFLYFKFYSHELEEDTIQMWYISLHLLYFLLVYNQTYTKSINLSNYSRIYPTIHSTIFFFVCIHGIFVCWRHSAVECWVSWKVKYNDHIELSDKLVWITFVCSLYIFPLVDGRYSSNRFLYRSFVTLIGSSETNDIADNIIQFSSTKSQACDVCIMYILIQSNIFLSCSVFHLNIKNFFFM